MKDIKTLKFDLDREQDIIKFRVRIYDYVIDDLNEDFTKFATQHLPSGSFNDFDLIEKYDATREILQRLKFGQIY